jgi:hypothetical protein
MPDFQKQKSSIIMEIKQTHAAKEGHTPFGTAMTGHSLLES